MLPPTSHRPFCWIPFWCTRCVEVEATSRFACHFTRRRSSCSSSISSNNKKLHRTVNQQARHLQSASFSLASPIPVSLPRRDLTCLLPAWHSVSLSPVQFSFQPIALASLSLRVPFSWSLCARPISDPASASASASASVSAAWDTLPVSRTRAKALRSLASLLSSTAPQS